MSETLLDRETRATLADLMASRANVYRVLSRCYRSEIDTTFARELSSEFAFESDDETLTTTLAAMRRALTDVDDATIERLAVTFDRVFFGMGPLTARHAFPYESVYTSDRGIMMQEAYAQVARAYREQSLAKDPRFTEPEDHLAVELAFMATLADRACAFLRACDEANSAADGQASCEANDEAATETVRQSLAFARTHLLNWIDRFCGELAAAASPAGDDGFYVALAQFTERFVQSDAALLEEML